MGRHPGDPAAPWIDQAGVAGNQVRDRPDRPVHLFGAERQCAGQSSEQPSHHSGEKTLVEAAAAQGQAACSTGACRGPLPLLVKARMEESRDRIVAAIVTKPGPLSDEELEDVTTR